MSPLSAAQHLARLIPTETLGLFRPQEVEPCSIYTQPNAPLYSPKGPLKVLTWNLQFCAGTKKHFFYDGGPSVRADRRAVKRTLRRVVEVLRRLKPDVLLLQEVDRDSRRTHAIDQLRHLSEALDYPCFTSATYHRAPYVPVPYWEPMGHVHMDLVIFSRFQLQQARRISLSPLNESPLRRALNLRRAMLHVQLLGTSGPIHLVNTHLSAFSYNDGTLERQISEVDDCFSALNGPSILGGDFNALPTHAQRDALDTAHQTLYAPSSRPIQRLLTRYPHARPAPWESPRSHTYCPWDRARADRTIDYLFHSKHLDVMESEVMHECAGISDHLPILTTLVPKEEP